MRIRLVCVGKPKDRELEALHERYAERIRKFGVAYESSWVEETRAGGLLSEERARERDSQALLASIGARASSVVLDPAGEMWSSEELSRRIERFGPAVSFLVGGPLGHDPVLRARGTHAWSLSRLTFPHELVRVLVAEQIYRALTILRRVPYHK